MTCSLLCLLLCLVAFFLPCVSIWCVTGAECLFWCDLVLFVLAVIMGGGSFVWHMDTLFGGNVVVTHVLSFSPGYAAIFLALFVLICDDRQAGSCGKSAQSNSIGRRTTRRENRERRERRMARRVATSVDADKNENSEGEREHDSLLELAKKKRSDHARDVKLEVLSGERRGSV